MTTLRQLYALARVLGRSWIRGGGSRPSTSETKSRRIVLGILRVGVLVGLGFGGATGGLSGAKLARPDLFLEWQLAGVFLAAFGQGLITEIPLPRRRTPGVLGPFAETLPLTLGARTASLALAQAPALSYWLALFVAGGSAFRRGPFVAALAASLWLTAFVWGAGAGKVLRVLTSGARVARLGWIAFLAIFGGFYGPYLGGAIAARHARHVGRHFGKLPPLAEALFHGGIGVRALAFGGVALVFGLGIALVRAADRRSYDRTDALPGATSSKKGAIGKPVNLRTIEVILRMREPERWTTSIFLFLALSIASGGVVYMRIDPKAADVLDSLVLGVALVSGQLALILGWTRAQRAIARDVLARPFLGGLPLTPHATLAGKVRLIRLELVSFVLPLVALLFAGREVLGSSLVWRLPIALAALLLYAEAIVAVAFLTVGLGDAGGGRRVVSLEMVLVAAPFLGSMIGMHLPDALLSLAGLAAIAFEGRRSARRALEWIDDPGHEHETPVWRALLVLAAFQVIQGLAATVMASFLAPENAAPAAYVVAALALVFLTLQGRPRRDPHAPRWAATRVAAFVAIGALGGVATGFVGVIYVHGLRRLGWLDPPMPPPGGAVFPYAIALMAVLVAPVAEELFFRGWLQPSIAGELGARRQIWAPVITAAAFAAVHPAVSFVPVLALGLVTGALFARSRFVYGGIAAHVVHNAIAIVLAH